MKDTLSALAVVTDLLRDAHDAKKLVKAQRYQVLPREQGFEGEVALQQSIRKTFDHVSALLDRAQTFGLISKQMMEEKMIWPGDECHITIGFDYRLDARVALIYKDPLKAVDESGEADDSVLYYNRPMTRVKETLAAAAGHLEHVCETIIREETQAAVNMPENALTERPPELIS